jgi:hypothetical protein
VVAEYVDEGVSGADFVTRPQLIRMLAAVVQPADPATARALLAVARHARDALERAGLVTDDVPDAVLAAVSRWCDGVASDAEVRGARAEVYAPREGLNQSGATRMLGSAVWDLAAYVGGGPGVQRARYVEHVLYGARCCLTWTGEAADAAEARVRAVYERALGDAARRNGGG